MRRSAGFTLVEILAVVLIFAIVSLFAASSYREYVVEANRTEARSALELAAATLEKCRSRFGVYDHVDCGYADFATESNVYQVTAALAATGYTLTATPVVGSVQAADAECTSLSLNNIGIKGATGTAVADCW